MNHLPLDCCESKELFDCIVFGGGGGGSGLPVMLLDPIFLGSVLERDIPRIFSLLARGWGPTGFQNIYFWSLKRVTLTF